MTLLAALLLCQIQVVDHRVPEPCRPVVNPPVLVRSLEVVNHTLSKTQDRGNVGYNTRTAGKFWYHGGQWPQARHLNEGEHAGLFDVGWLNSLSPQHLLNLHSDAHERCVDWSRAFRPGEYKAPTAVAKQQRWVQRCVNGRCYLMMEWY